MSPDSTTSHDIADDFVWNCLKSEQFSLGINPASRQNRIDNPSIVSRLDIAETLGHGECSISVWI
jgi:hypothetical protein